MQDISKVDKNLAVSATIQKDGLCFYDVKKPPFAIYGLLFENGKFRRMPEQAATNVSENIYLLHTFTAGGRVRFRTNSKRIAIQVKLARMGSGIQQPLLGSSGFDLYMERDGVPVHCRSFPPPAGATDGYESVVEFLAAELREITIHFPLYCEVHDLLIGIEEDAVLEAAASYRIEKPIVFYGSSITQGGCCSRPGNTYQSILCRAIDADHINLGFSGSAKGEPAMTEYIKGLDMSAFVLDYDHNAPTVEHLAQTHYAMYEGVRKAHPHIPIILLPRPKYHLGGSEPARHEVVLSTYEKAKAQGDENVYMLSGRQLMELAGDDGTVDSVHPNDLGFFSMAQALIPLFRTLTFPEKGL